MQVRDVGAAATGGLVVAGALTVPGMVRRLRAIAAEERRRDEGIREQVGKLEEHVNEIGDGLRDVGEDLSELVGFVAGAVSGALELPHNVPLSRLVDRRAGAHAIISEVEAAFEQERQRRKADAEAKRRAEEAEAGTSLRCPECDELRPDYVAWNDGSKKDSAPACPGCGSDQEPKAPEHD